MGFDLSFPRLETEGDIQESCSDSGEGNIRIERRCNLFVQATSARCVDLELLGQH
jgi:hypothetical protein